MLDIKKFTASFAVSPQISVTDLDKIAGMGFKSVINNRPDGEVAGQALSTDIEEKCRELDIEYVYLPVISGELDADSIIQFNKLLDLLPSPILAFCRSGTRCSILWISSAEDPVTLNNRLQCANAQGYSLNPGALPLVMLRK